MLWGRCLTPWMGVQELRLGSTQLAERTIPSAKHPQLGSAPPGLGQGVCRDLGAAGALEQWGDNRGGGYLAGAPPEPAAQGLAGDGQDGTSPEQSLISKGSGCLRCAGCCCAPRSLCACPQGTRHRDWGHRGDQGHRSGGGGAGADADAAACGHWLPRVPGCVPSGASRAMPPNSFMKAGAAKGFVSLHPTSPDKQI